MKNALAPDDWQLRPEMIRRFIEQRPDYELLGSEIGYILQKKLRTKEIEFASITHRAKNLNSFLEKLRRKSYEDPFVEITDFAGARVVCLYRDDLDRIEQIIRDEFDVLEKVDKLNDKDVDRFGYGAIHFVVQLGQKSSGARYDDLKTLKCEIQTRTVLQDAWAIVQHHLVYKNEKEIPSAIHRKLNGLSGLFEIVDDQYQQVRIQRDQYIEAIRDSRNDPPSLLRNPVNLDTVSEYLKWKFPEVQSSRNLVGWLLHRVASSRFDTLAELNEVVDRNRQGVDSLILKMGLDASKTSAATHVAYALLLEEPTSFGSISPKLRTALKEVRSATGERLRK